MEAIRYSQRLVKWCTVHFDTLEDLEAFQNFKDDKWWKDCEVDKEALSLVLSTTNEVASRRMYEIAKKMKANKIEFPSMRVPRKKKREDSEDDPQPKLPADDADHEILCYQHLQPLLQTKSNIIELMGVEPPQMVSSGEWTKFLLNNTENIAKFFTAAKDLSQTEEDESPLKKTRAASKKSEKKGEKGSKAGVLKQPEKEVVRTQPKRQVREPSVSKKEMRELIEWCKVNKSKLLNKAFKGLEDFEKYCNIAQRGREGLIFELSSQKDLQKLVEVLYARK